MPSKHSIGVRVSVGTPLIRKDLIDMFRKHKFTFKKVWLDRDTFEFSTITDESLIRMAIVAAKQFNLKINKIELSNLYQCRIVLKGKNSAYLSFLEVFLEATKGYLEEINI